ncbi:MAG: recombinase A [Polyangiaceae bacterium]
MALPAHLAERFSPALSRALRLGSTSANSGGEGLAFGIPALDAVLPDGGLLRGGVVELAVGEGVPATTLSLAVCEALQRSHQSQGRALPWSAFVDPSGTLYAPGVVESGVKPERLLVVRPPLEALSRTLLKLAKSPAFELIIVDTLGVPGAHLRFGLDAWPRVVRRLALELQGSERSIVLLTDRTLPRALPLPVAQRIDVTRPLRDRLMVQVSKDRRGQITPLRPVAWSRPRLLQIAEPAEEVRRAAVG